MSNTEGRSRPLGREQTTEVRTRGHHDAALIAGLLQNHVVVSRSKLLNIDVDDVVTVLFEDRREPVGQVLVQQQPHADSRQGKLVDSVAWAAYSSATPPAQQPSFDVDVDVKALS